MSILTKQNRILFHILFWISSIFAFAFIFKLSNSICKLDIIYTLFFHIIIITAVYLNFWGIKRWFRINSYLKCTLSAIVIIAFAILLNHYIFEVFVDLVLPDYYFVSQFNDAETGIIIVIYLIITSTIKLSKSWFDLQRMNQRLIIEEKEKIDGELQSLKTQINPHFLFNSLNVIYSLALKKDEATTEVILKLSDILRYVIYDSTQNKVTLNSEVSLLKKYIELQKYRVEDSTPIKFISNIEKDVEVAPLIFLTLVENSFKHGIKSDTDNLFLNIDLYSDSDKVCFEIENNKAETDTTSNRSSGVGLENIRKRLALQYSNKYKLEISENEKTFKVYLEIEHEN